MCYATPYRCMPRLMVRELISQGNLFLNAFGSKESASTGLSPRNLVDNLPHVDFNDLKYKFGEYIQLHVQEQVTNNMKSRTIGAIVLGPRNITGRYNFMSLETGAQIDGRVVASLPITNDVIDCVESLGKAQNQPFNLATRLRYEWRPGHPVEDNDPAPPVNTTPLPQPPQQITQPLQADIPTTLDLAQGAEETGSDQGASQEDDDLGELLDLSEDELEPRVENEEQGDDIDEEQNTNQGAHETALTPIPEDEEESSDDESSSDDDESSSDDSSIEERRNKEREERGDHFKQPTEDTHGRGKRTRKFDGSYKFLQAKFEDLIPEERTSFLHSALAEYQSSGKTNMIERYTTGFVFNQYSLSAKQGIKKYGRLAELKLLDEFRQLIEYKTFHGRHAHSLTPEQKRQAARQINLIEEKVNRGHTPDNPIIKGRSVYNGRVQRGLYEKKDTASPTVSQDAFFLTCIVDALEGRDKAITDIKGAYLNAKMKHEVFMKITGQEVDLFIELNPELEKFVTIEKQKRVLYVQLDKALYGCVQSALLWYELYMKSLKKMGFVVNPYDMCVANAMIDGKQCTIVWYVDDNKISHENPKVVDKVIKMIESNFGKMSKTRGDTHEFLGMKITFKDKKVEIDMKNHIQKAIDAFPEKITRKAASPAAAHMFDTRNVKRLPEKMADIFHSITASLLFISRRCRLDIQTAVAFLCTRVSDPDEDDWKKLKRVLQYLHGTMDLVLTLGADDISKMKTWVDVSYGIHDDCKSHTGGAMSWGWGVLLTKCQKQKLNTKSSTEGEIVGVSDFLPNMIWARMFLEAQGFQIEENILYQDNQSAILIEKNGRRSSGQKTKHMDNRFFWIKDRVESEGIKIEYCPTAQMLADFFTKPLQGNLFRTFRDIVMGYKHIMSLHDDRSNSENVSSQERVRKNDSCKTVNGSETVLSLENKHVSWADVVKGVGGKE